MLCEKTSLYRRTTFISHESLLRKPRGKDENRLFIAAKMLGWQEWWPWDRSVSECVHCCASCRPGIQNERPALRWPPPFLQFYIQEEIAVRSIVNIQKRLKKKSVDTDPASGFSCRQNAEAIIITSSISTYGKQMM